MTNIRNKRIYDNYVANKCDFEVNIFSVLMQHVIVDIPFPHLALACTFCLSVIRFPELIESNRPRHEPTK